MEDVNVCVVKRLVEVNQTSNKLHKSSASSSRGRNATKCSIQVNMSSGGESYVRVKE